MSPQALIRYSRVLNAQGRDNTATFCWHPDCKPDEHARLISIDVTAALAALKGAQHEATHQPTDKAS